MNDSVRECDNLAVMPSVSEHLVYRPPTKRLSPSSWCAKSYLPHLCLYFKTHQLIYFKDTSLIWLWWTCSSIRNVFYFKNSCHKQCLRVSSRGFGKTSWLFVTEWGMCCEKTCSSREELSKRCCTWKNSFPLCLNFRHIITQMSVHE